MPARAKDRPTAALVVGHHPAAHLAAALLADKKIAVTHLAPPTPAPADGLVLLNPALFKLHKRLNPLADTLDLTPIHGIAFLSDDPAIAGRHAADSPLGYVTRLAPLRDATAAMAEESGVNRLTPKQFKVNGVDETGVHAEADGRAIDAQLLLLASELPPEDAAAVSVPPVWPDAQLRRLTRLDVPTSLLADADGPPVIPMALDLAGHLCWAWLLADGTGAQAFVEQPVDPAQPGAALAPADLMARWLDALVKHGVLTGTGKLNPAKSVSRALPFAGALEREAVADRTLLFGPAGGFYSATGEDVYPNCWSALFAADVASAALKADHPQDALAAYRGKWGASLGDYLRGPQQNLRLLLPLIYKNPQMTARFVEAILLGKSVVR